MPEIDLDVAKHALQSRPIQAVHPGITSVFRQSSEEKSSFLLVQEARILRPVHYQELGDYSDGRVTKPSMMKIQRQPL